MLCSESDLSGGLHSGGGGTERSSLLHRYVVTLALWSQEKNDPVQTDSLGPCAARWRQSKERLFPHK